MYQVRFKNRILYDPRDDEERIIREPSVHLAVDEPGSMSFTIDADHPEAGQLTKMVGDLELLQDGYTIYCGRIIRDEMDFYNSRRIETEGLLAALNDSIIPPFTFPDDFTGDAGYQEAAASGNVVEFFLGWLLTQHNSQAAEDRKIKLGTVTVADPNNYISRSSTDYATTWDTVKNKLADGSLGGHLLPRYEADGVYLDYLADFTLTNEQPVEFGENLLDLTSEVDATEVYTAILPVGKDGLTIEGLADGSIKPGIVKAGKIIYSEAGRQQFGNITKVVKWEDVEVAENLKSKAVAELTGTGILMANSITVKACDLHCDDDTIASFRVGRYVTITSKPHDLIQSFGLVTLEPDILDPGNTVITLGTTVKSQTDRNQATQKTLENTQAQQQIELDKQAKKISDLGPSSTELVTAAVQNSQEIIFAALAKYVETGDFNSYKETVIAQLSVLAGEISRQFQTGTEAIKAVNGDLQAKYNERTKYIRFVDGDIILGEDGNEITLTIENDRMTFKQNGHEVAWFSNNQFHVTDAEFSGPARIGSFAFVPGSNGNLSFRKVVT